MKRIDFLFVTLLLLYTACCFRREADVYHSLSSGIKNSVPYTTGDSLRFMSSEGDTMLVKVYYDLSFWDDNCAECCKLTYNEELSCSLIPTDPDAFRIACDAHAEYYFSVDSTIPAPLHFYGKQGGFTIWIAANGSPLCDTTLSSTIVTCHDLFTINTKTYQQVLELENIDSVRVQTEETLLRMFYSTEQGVLRWEEKNGKFWELIPQ